MTIEKPKEDDVFSEEKIQKFTERFPTLQIQTIRDANISASWRVTVGASTSFEDAKAPQWEGLSNYVNALHAAAIDAKKAYDAEADPALKKLLFIQATSLKIEADIYYSGERLAGPLVKFANWPGRIKALMSKVGANEALAAPLILTIKPDLTFLVDEVKKRGFQIDFEKSQFLNALKGVADNLRKFFKEEETAIAEVETAIAEVETAIAEVETAIDQAVAELETVEVSPQLRMRAEIEETLKQMGLSDSPTAIAELALSQAQEMREELEKLKDIEINYPKTETEAAKRALGVKNELLGLPFGGKTQDSEMVTRPETTVEIMAVNGTTVVVSAIGNAEVWGGARPTSFEGIFTHELIHVVQRRSRLDITANDCAKEGFGKMGEWLSAELKPDPERIKSALFGQLTHAMAWNLAWRFHSEEIDEEGLVSGLREICNEPNFYEKWASMIMINPTYLANYYLGMQFAAADIHRRFPNLEDANMQTWFAEKYTESGLKILPHLSWVEDPARFSLIDHLQDRPHVGVRLAQVLRNRVTDAEVQQAGEEVAGAVESTLS